jgi:hypothetical protein
MTTLDDIVGLLALDPIALLCHELTKMQSESLARFAPKKKTRVSNNTTVVDREVSTIRPTKTVQIVSIVTHQAA